MSSEKPEDLIGHLYNEEENPADREKFKKRLENDADARQQIETWRATQGRLDEWEIATKSSNRPGAFAMTGWGIAALLALGLSFVLGKGNEAPLPDIAAIQSEIRENLTEELSAEFQDDLAALKIEMENDFAQQLRTEISGDFAEQLQTEISSFSTNILAAVEVRSEQSIEELLALWNTGRQQDMEAISELIRKMRGVQQAEYVMLREDLETVALNANDRFNLTLRGLDELAALSVTSYDFLTDTNLTGPQQ